MIEESEMASFRGSRMESRSYFEWEGILWIGQWSLSRISLGVGRDLIIYFMD